MSLDPISDAIARGLESADFDLFGPIVENPLPATMSTRVLISLDGTATFAGPNDDVTRYVHAEKGVQLDEGRDGAQQLNPPKIGAGGFDLTNSRGQWSPDNASGLGYQQLRPGTPVSYLADHGTRRPYRSHTRYRAHVPYRGIGRYPLARHVVDDLPETTEIGARRVSIETIGYETILTRAPVTVPLMITPLVSECLTALLNAVSWPLDKRDIAISDTRLLLWWCDERAPWTAMLELLASEGPGMFGIRRDGTFYFENRNYRTTTVRSTISQAVFNDHLAGGRTRYRAHVPYRAHRLYRGRQVGLTYSNLVPANGFKSVYNRATYTTRRRITLPTPVQIYQYGVALTLTAGQVLPLFVRPSDPFINAVTPVLGVDYAVTSGAATVSMTYSSGILAILTLTAGPAGATIDSVVPGTGLQLRAQPMTVASETTVQNSIDASASIAQFSPIPGQNIPLTLPVAGWPEIDTAQAVGVCNAWVLRQQLPRAQASFTIQGSDARHLEQILKRAPSDRVTLVHVLTGRRVDVWINASTIDISGAAGRTVELKVSAERCDGLLGAVWDDPAALWNSAIWSA